jgi:outer membrane protein OmpA-like peptidoglycan-associated protein
MREAILIFILSCYMSPFAFAAENSELNFQTTEQGIIQSLTAETPKIKTRGIAKKTRGIVVVGLVNDKVTQQEILVDVNAPPPSVNLKIEFDVNSSAIRPESYPLLDQLGKALTSEKLTQQAIVIKGHTDSDGNETYNLNLSMDRAKAVKSFLVRRFAIPDSRLEVYGYGQSMPLVPDVNPANKQINRRVEVAVR